MSRSTVYQTDKPLSFGIYAGHTSAYPQIIGTLCKVLEAPLPDKRRCSKPRSTSEPGPLNDLVAGGRQHPSSRCRSGLGVPVPKNTFAKNCKAAGPASPCNGSEIEEPDTAAPRPTAASAPDFQQALTDEFGDLLHSDRETDRPGRKPSQRTKRNALIKAARKLSVDATFNVSGRAYYQGVIRPRKPMNSTSLLAALCRAGSMPRVLAWTRPCASASSSLHDLAGFPLRDVEEPGKLFDFCPRLRRLSYFLWNSTPDETLLDLDPPGESSAIPRCSMRKPTGCSTIPRPAASWTTLPSTNGSGCARSTTRTPDHKLYPDYARNDQLKRFQRALRHEAFFRRVLDENLGVRESRRSGRLGLGQRSSWPSITA